MCEARSLQFSDCFKCLKLAFDSMFAEAVSFAYFKPINMAATTTVSFSLKNPIKPPSGTY